MGPPPDFNSLQESIQEALKAVTRSSNQVAAEDLAFQKTSDPDVEEQLDETKERLLSLTTALLKSATADTKISAPRLEDAEDVEMHWTRIVDAADTLLEKADTCLDEYTGLIKRKAAPATDSATSAPQKPNQLSKQWMPAADIPKPQLTFERKPDNFDTTLWKPLLTSKPHATVALEDSLAPSPDESQENIYKHPYATEILNLSYPSCVFEVKEPIEYAPLETTPVTFVNTFDGVLEMLEELKAAKEIAVDLEHHDFRTYHGLLSLMQISTREKDWIVDTLQPWRHKLEVLNEVFADPNIVKVLHGAYMDIIWLQRDCGLYVVGLFDTYEASVALGYEKKSLKALLEKFTSHEAKKEYQLADWRERPLNEEQLRYAQADTHFLLYVYDKMRNELLERSDKGSLENDLMRQTLEGSKATSLRRYQRFDYDADEGQGPFGWYNLLTRNHIGNLTGEQFAVFRAAHQWRDELARREDESPLYLIRNDILFTIARRLPPDQKALLSILGRTKPVVKRVASDLFDAISKARVGGETGPSLTTFLKSRSSDFRGASGSAQALPTINKTVDSSVDIKDLMSESSRLWGTVPMSTRWERDSSNTNPVAKNMQFALPWAQFVENASVATEQPTASSQHASQSSPAPESASQSRVAEEEDKEFTLKAGLKRKAPESDDESDSGEDGGVPIRATPQKAHDASLGDEEIDLSDSSSESKKRAKKQSKKARKAERKKQKLEAKQAKLDARKLAEAANGKDEDDDSDAPLDYAMESKKKSILNAGRSASSNGGKKFDPYTEKTTLEGPKPARRMHGEKTGKSATFKK